MTSLTIWVTFNLKVDNSFVCIALHIKNWVQKYRQNSNKIAKKKKSFSCDNYSIIIYNSEIKSIQIKKAKREREKKKKKKGTSPYQKMHTRQLNPDRPSNMTDLSQLLSSINYNANAFHRIKQW